MSRFQLIVAGLLFGVCGVASATDLEVRGGYGGANFRSVCAPGSYLAGMQVRLGDWIDQIRPVCAEVDSNFYRKPGVPSADLIGGSGGNRYDDARCKEGHVAAGLSVVMITDPGFGNNLGVISRMRIFCNGVAPPFLFDPHGIVGVYPRAGNIRLDSDILFGISTDSKYVKFEVFNCPPGELATGLWGRAGDFVDAIGLVCGPGPQAAAPVVAAVEPTRPVTSVSDSSLTRMSSSSMSVGGSVVASQPVAPAPVAPAPAPVYAAMPTPGVPEGDNVRYNSPYIAYSGGVAPLDVCRIWGQECGTPAADAFCTLMDPTRPFAVATEGFPNIGNTAVIGTGQRCTESFCSGFRFVVCGAER